jgi:hypothetical protein
MVGLVNETSSATHLACATDCTTTADGIAMLFMMLK